MEIYCWLSKSIDVLKSVWYVVADCNAKAENFDRLSMNSRKWAQGMDQVYMFKCNGSIAIGRYRSTGNAVVSAQSTGNERALLECMFLLTGIV